MIRLVVPLQVVEWIPNFYFKSQRLSQSTRWRRQAACRAVGTGGAVVLLHPSKLSMTTSVRNNSHSLRAAMILCMQADM